MNHTQAPVSGVPDEEGSEVDSDLEDLRDDIARLDQSGHVSEALNHLDLLAWDLPQKKEFVKDFPFLVYDLASELSRGGRQQVAIEYFQLLRECLGDTDSAVLLQLGRGYLALGKQSNAEECLLAAIEADHDSIDARIELANIYERAREDEEALILAAEAMALQDARARSANEPATKHSITSKYGRRPPRRCRRRCGSLKEPSSETQQSSWKSVVPRRYRPKRLTDPQRRIQEEQDRAAKLTSQYEAVRDLKREIAAGRHDLVPIWMSTCKELVDDFRSLKRFYTWEKYLHFLGSKRRCSSPVNEGQQSELSEMYDRLSRCVAPHGDQVVRGMGFGGLKAHRGIAFDEWLDLFLDYAISLAILHRREEAYQICKAAKDSNVFQSSESCFSIHVAWTVCAIYTNDEAHPAEMNIDICLLMLYGHILFTSTSYAYSLSYFLRARSIDPSNPMQP
ncbi:Transcription factor tau subunit sfc4 [Ophiocordyceps camponoti-floridani]|uniref:Transcription factor tau subunit sfc4 n=1 Tax=Ophiocordyceps camponoti-floridani TaxID=2030778 RepID=A0A8H4Q6H3_9HYPO|nr:Transcription factor tau subunit sfc4 [Ophiocordyceps camponoti-floridani]